MREHGVHYPGAGRNHRRAVSGFLGTPDLLAGPLSGTLTPPGATMADMAVPSSRGEWVKLMDDVAAEPGKRVVVSHEFAARATDDEAARFVADLGVDKTHVAITLRPLASMLVSRWTQVLKSGASDTLDDWLTKFILEPEKRHAPDRYGTLNISDMVERWAAVVGPGNVTVIVLDKDRRQLAAETFEQMLGLPGSTLTSHISHNKLTNRSTTAVEAELIRRVNESVFNEDAMSWPVYRDVVRRGAVRELLEHRLPEDAEPAVRLPAWAADTLASAANDNAERIAASGVRVVGDLTNFCAPPVVAEDLPQPDSKLVFEVAETALTGAVNGAMGYEKQLAKQVFRAQSARRRDRAALKKARRRIRKLESRTIRDQVEAMPAAQRPRSAARSYTTRDLVRAVGVRVKYKVRTGKSMKLK